MDMLKSPSRSFVTLVKAVALAAWFAAGPATAQPAAETAAGPTRAQTGATKPCIECHEGFYSITRTKHGVKGDPRTPAATGKTVTSNPDDAMCSSCHGDLAAHNRTPRAKNLVPIVFGRKADPGPQNEACLSCHQSGTRIHWQGSKHEQTKQSCASCHRVHAPKDPVLVAETQASVCFDCHKDRRAELHRMSTHPTKAGFFSCSSCHASHGSTAQRASLQKNTVNETCYQCHAQLRGPFLWEHRSAQDDCTNCHNPHGTNNPPMLKVKQPYLCQQCHQSVNHSTPAFSGITLPGGPGSTATVTTGAIGPYPAVGTVAGSGQRILGNACVTCHVKVHGSNHPSGARLQR